MSRGYRLRPRGRSICGRSEKGLNAGQYRLLAYLVKLRGAVRVLPGSREEREVQPQVQVATGASWAVVEFVIAVFLPRRAAEAQSWRGLVRVLPGHEERGGSAPVPGRDRSELGGGDSSSRCSFRGGRRGPKLAGAVRVLPGHARSGDVQPQVQVATGASWRRWIRHAMFLPRRARPEAAGRYGAAGSGAEVSPRSSATGSGPSGLVPVFTSRRPECPARGRYGAGTGRDVQPQVQVADRSELGGVFVMRWSFRGGRRGPKLAGAVRVCRVTRGAGEVQPQFQVDERSELAAWSSSCPVPSAGRAELGGGTVTGLQLEFVMSVITEVLRGGHRARCCWGGARRVQRAGQSPVPGAGRTGASWVGAAVHCWVASWASIDSMALTIVFMWAFPFTQGV